MGLRIGVLLGLAAGLGLPPHARAESTIARTFRCAPPQPGDPSPYPYPYPADPNSGGQKVVQLAWSGLGGGDNGLASFAPIEIRNGQLLLNSVSVDASHRFDALVQPLDTEPGEEYGRSNEDWFVTNPFRDFGFNHFIRFFCPGGDPCQTTRFANESGSSGGSGSSQFNAFFDPNDPDVFDTSLYGPAGSVDVQASVLATFVPQNGIVDFMDVRADVTIRVARTLNEWRAHEVLAKRMEPEIEDVPLDVGGAPGQKHIVVQSVLPRFGFTQDEAGRLSQYHHFNWYQELTDYFIAATGPTDGIRLDDAQLLALPTGYPAFPTFGRGYGPDPLPEGQFGVPGDGYLGYWDEVDVPGRTGAGGTTDFRWSSPFNEHGLGFEDVPGLPESGQRAQFVTFLVGVKKDGMCDVLAKLDIPNRDDFVFRWTYRQTRRGPPAGSGVFTRLENADPSIPDTGQGEFMFLGFGEGDVVVRGPEGGFDIDGDAVPSESDVCPDVNDPAQLDGDADGFGDACDVCRLVADPAQIDADEDGFGNVCDADFDQNGIVNFLDLSYLKQTFFTDDATTDLNGDGIVNFGDLQRLKAAFFQPPGPGKAP